jgi:hypothetical protein
VSAEQVRFEPEISRFRDSRFQVDELRSMLDANDEPLQGNFREVQPLNGRHVFHACPSGSKYATLLALP